MFRKSLDDILTGLGPRTGVFSSTNRQKYLNLLTIYLGSCAEAEFKDIAIRAAMLQDCDAVCLVFQESKTRIDVDLSDEAFLDSIYDVHQRQVHPNKVGLPFKTTLLEMHYLKAPLIDLFQECVLLVDYQSLVRLASALNRNGEHYVKFEGGKEDSGLRQKEKDFGKEKKDFQICIDLNEARHQVSQYLCLFQVMTWPKFTDRLDSMFKFLLDNGADPTIIDGYGCTALHFGIKHGRSAPVLQSYIKQLRNSGHEKCLKELDGEGKTPLQLVQWGGHEKEWIDLMVAALTGT